MEVRFAVLFEKFYVSIEGLNLSYVSGVTRTPSNKTGNFLADFAPLDRPMVPPAIEVCLEEVNRRGIREVGIYR